MKRLWIWIIFSIALHFLLLRFISFKKEFPEQEIEKYEVTLLYYLPEKEKVKKEKPKRSEKETVKEKIVKQKVEEKEKYKEKEDEKIEPEIKDPDKEVFDLKKPEEPVLEKSVLKEELSEVEKKPEPLKELKLEEKQKVITTASQKSEEIINIKPVIDGLRKRIMQELVYPYVARKKGLEGVVLVTIRLDKDGNLLDVRITKSSGHSILDNAAVQLVQKVAPYQHNLGKSLSVQVPIRYSLIN